MLRIKSPQDFGAAIILIVIGLAGLWFGREYELGTISQMGPGYMPRLLSIGLLLFGGVIGARALTVAGPPRPTRPRGPAAAVPVLIPPFAFLGPRRRPAPA